MLHLRPTQKRWECRILANSCLSWSLHQRCFLRTGNVRSSRQLPFRIAPPRPRDLASGGTS